MSPTDYIMRLIEQFSMILSRILFKKQAQQYPTALLDIQKTYAQLLGLDAEWVHSMSDQALLTWLNINGTFDVEKCLVLAVLLKEETEIRELGGIDNHHIQEDYRKSFSLYVEALNRDRELRTKGHFDNVDFLLNHCTNTDWSPDQQFKVFQYNELSGRFDKAEDALFELIRRDYPGILANSEAFYKRLLAKTDRELEAGNLPRAEVREGLSTIQKHQP